MFIISNTRRYFHCLTSYKIQYWCVNKGLWIHQSYLYKFEIHIRCAYTVSSCKSTVPRSFDFAYVWKFNMISSWNLGIDGRWQQKMCFWTLFTHLSNRIISTESIPIKHLNIKHSLGYFFIRIVLNRFIILGSNEVIYMIISNDLLWKASVSFQIGFSVFLLTLVSNLFFLSGSRHTYAIFKMTPTFNLGCFTYFDERIGSTANVHGRYIIGFYYFDQKCLRAKIVWKRKFYCSKAICLLLLFLNNKNQFHFTYYFNRLKDGARAKKQMTFALVNSYNILYRFRNRRDPSS